LDRGGDRLCVAGAMARLGRVGLGVRLDCSARVDAGLTIAPRARGWRTACLTTRKLPVRLTSSVRRHAAGPSRSIAQPCGSAIAALLTAPSSRLPQCAARDETIGLARDVGVHEAGLRAVLARGIAAGVAIAVDDALCRRRPGAGRSRGRYGRRR
jgi:hypothetical protein